MQNNSTVKNQNNISWESVLELVYDSKIDSVGLKERVSSLATRSIKKDSKLQALNMIVSMCDLTMIIKLNLENLMMILLGQPWSWLLKEKK